MVPLSLQPDIGYHVSRSKIPGRYRRTIGHEVIGRPLSYFSINLVCFSDQFYNLEGIQ